MKKPKKAARMTKAEKAVAVAKDVIAQIKAKKMKPKHMVYLDMKLGKIDANKLEGKDLKDVLPKVKSCEVCAIGGALVSYAKLFDGVPLHGEFDMENECSVVTDMAGNVEVDADDDYIREVLSNILSMTEIKALEEAFESGVDGQAHEGDSYAHMIPGARAYGESLPKDATKRMVILMQNIIDHDGEFHIPAKFLKPEEEVWG